jgi:hypothetical protein
MTDQEFDQLFDNGESILETLDISTAHRINCPTDLMTNQHPITPPPELVQQWLCSDDYLWGPLEQKSITITANRLQNVATQAARWGADQELEACCEWVSPFSHDDCHYEDKLRAARRPKAPSLKEEALSLLDEFSDPEGLYLDVKSHNTIRRALEQLDD